MMPLPMDGGMDQTHYHQLRPPVLRGAARITASNWRCGVTLASNFDGMTETNNKWVIT